LVSLLVTVSYPGATVRHRAAARINAGPETIFLRRAAGRYRGRMEEGRHNIAGRRAKKSPPERAGKGIKPVSRRRNGFR